METVNVLNQMAEYDFRAPINVEMIFEESEDDESSHQKVLSEQQNTDINYNRQISVQISDTKNEMDTKSSKINNRVLKKARLSLNKNNKILKENPVTEMSKHNGNHLNYSNNVEIRENRNDVGHYINQNKTNTNQRALIFIDNEAINNEDSSLSTLQITNHNEQTTRFLDDLLNKLSEHIVRIMQSFHYYRVKSQYQDNKKREELFNLIKFHVFELSYTTMESIILPLEQNDSFINKFLDNTVLMANTKFKQWKCHKGHVLPFFRELLTWTKRRREQIKENHTQSPCNENITLRQQLLRPLLPLDSLSSKNVANNDVPTTSTQNNLCIFTSGAPGHEISINIDANTLINISENPQYMTDKRDGNLDNYTPSGESFKRSTPDSRPIYGNGVHDIQKNNSIIRRPPPPYNINHCSKVLPRTPPPYNKNIDRNYFNCKGHPHQNHQNIGQQIYNYHSQVQYGTRQISPSHIDSLNYLLYDNTSNNIPMHETQLEHQATSGPIITSVASLNPRTHNVHCFMCGKNTITSCASFNPLCREAYCSHLCQELGQPVLQTSSSVGKYVEI